MPPRDRIAPRCSAPWRKGTSGGSIHQEHFTYFLAGSDPIASDTVYGTTSGTDARTTSYTYGFYSGTNQINLMSITNPTINSGQNGPGSPDIEGRFFDTFGRMILNKDADGHVNMTEFDNATDAVTKTIADVNYSSLSSAEKSLFDATGWTHTSGLNLVTTYQVDAKGRTTKITSPNGNVRDIVFNDVNHEERIDPGFDGTNTPTQPGRSR